jgi:hypothetical protein
MRPPAKPKSQTTAGTASLVGAAKAARPHAGRRRRAKAITTLAASETLPYHVRGYAKALEVFDAHLSFHQKLISDLITFQPYQESITNLEAVVNEAREMIRRYLDDKIDEVKLDDLLSHDIAESLESVLDNRYRIAHPKCIADDIATYVYDTEDFTDRIFEDLSENGYNLYHVLIGAA